MHDRLHVQFVRCSAFVRCASAVEYRGYHALQGEVDTPRRHRYTLTAESLSLLSVCRIVAFYTLPSRCDGGSPGSFWHQYVSVLTPERHTPAIQVLLYSSFLTKGETSLNILHVLPVFFMICIITCVCYVLHSCLCFSYLE